MTDMQRKKASTRGHATKRGQRKKSFLPKTFRLLLLMLLMLLHFRIKLSPLELAASPDLVFLLSFPFLFPLSTSTSRGKRHKSLDRPYTRQMLHASSIYLTNTFLLISFLHHIHNHIRIFFTGYTVCYVSTTRPTRAHFLETRRK